jgi:hypothetical protein
VILSPNFALACLVIEALSSDDSTYGSAQIDISEFTSNGKKKLTC